MKKYSILFLLLFSTVACGLGQALSIKKIWDNGKYNAFTSIIEFKGKFYCSFREGESHIFDKNGKAEGKVRIIVSTDGEEWESAALLGKEGYDLRDPKLSIMPDGRLMIIMGGSIYENKILKNRIPQVSFSADGKNFSAPVAVKVDPQIKIDQEWLWRVTWVGDTAYTVSYSTVKNRLDLLKSTNGIDFTLVKQLYIDGFPNETTLRTTSDGEMFMMVRKDEGDQSALWGQSRPPYTEWSFTNIGLRIGGPDFIPLNDSLFVAGGRCHAIDLTNRKFTLIMTGLRDGRFWAKYILPSAGDNSYPGFIIVKDQLWVSYYSRHETTEYASVYLAKFPLDYFMHP